MTSLRACRTKVRLAWRLRGEFLPYLPTERTCFWGGWGGSLVVVDTHRRTTIAYTMNHMASDLVGSDRTRRYLELVYKALDA